MANFIERTLEPGEKVVFKGRLHWSYNLRYTIWGIILIVVAIAGAVFANMQEGNENEKSSDTAILIACAVVGIIGLMMIIYGYWIRSKTEFAITNSRFIQKDGIFNIKMTEIPLFKVETVNFYQSFGERILGTGAIELVGSGGTNHKVEYVQHPFKVRNIITTYMKENKTVTVPVQQSAPQQPAQQPVAPQQTTSQPTPQQSAE